ncbi:MAG: hypothetical protein JWN21_227 [Sphingomonas bacterium]|uniref:tetratricopeptide repeat protein n=1 Tax=Sphingomonas bacterium TaxID=1895847 RepID=UPI0026201C58|nr:tetratricopeptide repeat protein [Sphingomonas bacterium]MDB5694684.1 hypothetical protein [Sphingomonas bacterium]
MPDVSAYPLLRSRRKKRWALPRLTRMQLRLGGVIAAAVLLIGAILWASRPGPPDAGKALADAQKTLDAGNYSAARRNAEIAIGAEPRSGAAHQLLARAHLELGQGLAAEAALDRAAQVGVPLEKLHALRAHARALQGQPERALDEAAKAWPGDAPLVARVRALALAAQGKGAQAQAVLEQRVAIAPNDARAWTTLGRLRLAAGEMGGAADAAAMAARLAPGEPAALTLQGEVVRARFGLVAALPWLEAALTRDAFHYPALIEQAATLGEAGRNVEALAATRKALRARPGSAPARYIQAVIATRGGQAELARRLLTAAGGGLNDLPGALLLNGAIDAATGRNEEAVARWRRLVAMQPMNVDARRLLAGALLRTGDARAALDMLRPLALRGDADGYSLHLASRAWEAAGDRGQAAGWLDRVGAQRADASALFATDETLPSLVGGAAMAADDPTYALGIIRGLMAAGDQAGALARARGLAAAAPRDPAALVALGDTLAASGRDGEAAAAFTRAADLRFDEPTAMRLIDALGRAGKPQDAAATLALYLGQNPQSLVARRLLGRWQVASGQAAAAIETLEGVRRRIGNRDASLLADLARAYAEEDGSAVARRYGQAAYRLAPMNPDVCDAYGVALAADGDPRARQLFDKAISLAPGNRVYLAHRQRLG